MADESGFTKDALPTQGGTYSAWMPESKDAPEGLTPDGWRPVPMRRDPHGIPGALHSEGINLVMGLCSFAQANAMAWAHAAEHEHRTGKSLDVRVVEYRVHYDIKCYRALDVPVSASQGSDGGKGND